MNDTKTMLPKVDFCGLNSTRLIIGANPFGGFSHQNRERDLEMRAYYTVDRIVETWQRAEAAGINTMVTNNETPHIFDAIKRYRNEGGAMQWIAQVNRRTKPEMRDCVEEVVAMGCRAIYFHGGQVDALFEDGNVKELTRWCDCARAGQVVVGVAGHAPEVHHWVDGLDLVDFHAVPFFNCGSLHDKKGEKFCLRDIARAVTCIRKLAKPCIAYKIMGAGRIDAAMAFEYALESIKPTDIVNVGMHRGDNDNMVEDNVAIVAKTLAR